MTRTHKRKIVVDDIEYEWSIRGMALYAEHLAIYKPSINGTPIHLDIVPWGLEIRPQTVADIIRYCLDNGWHPERKGQPLQVGFAHEQFVLLPEGCSNSLEYEKQKKK